MEAICIEWDEYDWNFVPRPEISLHTSIFAVVAYLQAAGLPAPDCRDRVEDDTTVSRTYNLYPVVIPERTPIAKLLSEMPFVQIPLYEQNLSDVFCNQASRLKAEIRKSGLPPVQLTLNREKTYILS